MDELVPTRGREALRAKEADTTDGIGAAGAGFAYAELLEDGTAAPVLLLRSDASGTT